MKVLIVCSGKPSNPEWNFKIHRSFVYEQVESLKKLSVEYDAYFIEGKGILGYLKNYPGMIRKIKEYKANLIHAHYGLSGLLACFQRIVPVIVTYHGSDINEKKNRKFSKLASIMAKENIFVHKDLPKKINYKKKLNIIPCGIDMDIFYPIDKIKAREMLKLNKNKIYALFSSSFDNEVKNFPLAQEAIKKSGKQIELIELKNFSREKVNLLMNAVDFLIVTSFSETGPLVVKEAMCCNTPIVTVDVGDVKEVIGKTKNCYIVRHDSDLLAEKIIKILEVNSKTNGRKRMNEYSLEIIAKKVLKVYIKVLNENK